MAEPIHSDADIEQALAGLSQEQRRAALESEARWRLALEIASEHVFHALQRL